MQERRRGPRPLPLVWDRNAAGYADAEAYDRRFYQTQLTELCTGYRPVDEIWFDGAGSQGRTHDWAGVMRIIDLHQPRATVSGMVRPSVRWVGNEDGAAGVRRGDPGAPALAAG